MKMSFAAGRKRGLTLVEVLVIMVIIALLAFMIYPGRENDRRRAMRIQCVSNLKQAGIAFRIWPPGQDDSFPMRVSVTNGGTMEFNCGPTAFRHFLVMSNELSTPKVLICPEDARRFQATTFSSKPLAGEIQFMSNSNLSYFVGLDAQETDPQRLLTGDRNLTNGMPPNNGILELTRSRPAGWTDEFHREVGNIALADGSVQQLSITGLNATLANTPGFTNRLLMPVLGQ
jgi:hypothetical protein